MSGKIAIVGAGPSGCYLAQALLKREPGLEVDLIDALPVPFGLTRYGVAADHQGTKAVARQFARIFERQGARFFGNVRVGQHVTLDQLRTAYDAVVLAAGLSADRPLAIPGADLPGVYGSARITRALNDHPDADPLPALGPHPVIIGNGNVAIDILRLLCKTPDELEGSDLGPIATDWLKENSLQSITVLGRSSASQAKFDPVMVRELGKLNNVQIAVDCGPARCGTEAPKQLQALADINGHGTDKAHQGPIKVTFGFDRQPLAVTGTTQATGLKVRGPERTETVPASALITAIGFMSDGTLARTSLLEKAGWSDQSDNGGRLAPGLYSAGWFRHGPRGTIPQSRADAQATAELIVSELDVDPDRPGRKCLSGLKDIVDYQGWTRIDAAERDQSPPGRCRQKFTTLDHFLNAAKQRA